ncbi:MAG: hypothetical protein DI623_02305 [Sphingomonas sanxanigenens]|uniref:Uncharacterized protein n=1 Tax=Sphingomonas sanxanigenens TaxID=397260 RepID=A0A2W5C9A5_9SPHN|nr:MAG: hypothetical protein DI623_02305 [Sphingomonas sanxanigenens]
MLRLPYVANRTCLTAATELIASFGEDAGLEAAARADRSRDIGNVHHFCHWRQVERLILVLASDEPVGTVH